MIKKLEEGKKAPEFMGLDQFGKQRSLKDYAGKKLIIFFYPQDNTPTCTVESCNLRDNYDVLREKGFEVLGISGDSQKKHQNFITKLNLPYDLIADTDLSIIKSFGVWGEKNTFGKTYDGIHRTTFVIDEAGNVIRRIDKVKSKDHTNQIIEELNNIK
jgi:thioredoxin-dependent peroxiredoxin